MKTKYIMREIDNILEPCFWFNVSKSTSKEGIQYRIQNPHIDFQKCRYNCPMRKNAEFCNDYISNNEMNLTGEDIFK